MENESTMGKLAWHVHHDKLCEILIEPIENRIEYIKRAKPLHEIETRLRLLQLVKGSIGEEWQKACQERRKAYQEWWKADQEWQKAYQEWRKADQEWQKAYQEWRKADQEWRKADREWQNSPEILTLHAIECPNCPWDGKTIFPEKQNGK